MDTFLRRFSPEIIVIIVAPLAIVAGSVVYARYIRHYRKFKDPMRRKAARGRDLYLQERIKTRSAAIVSQIAIVSILVILVTMPMKFFWVGFAIQLSAILGDIYWVHRNKKRFQESIRDEGFRICPNCFYSLRGSPDAGRCPECGYDYTIETLKEEWCHTLHVKP